MYELKPITYTEIPNFLNFKTIDIHYNKIYRGYINKLNFLLQEINFDKNISLIDVIKKIDNIPFNYRDEILYLSGAVTNHELYFQSISTTPVKPSSILSKAINDSFGNYEKFKNEFIATATKLMGSGYTALVSDGKILKIINFSNQDSPYSYNFIPLVTLDNWEHAYFLDYYNNRLQYINAFFNHINFEYANKIF